MSEPTLMCEPLLDLASPAIYRSNLFRILGVSIDASARDVQRQLQRRRMEERLGVASAGKNGNLLELNPAPSEQDIQLALERLNRPIDRLLHEIFWFWPLPGNGSGDAALLALAQGKTGEAVELWSKNGDHEVTGEISRHNVVVLRHLEALDEIAAGIDQQPGKKEKKRIAETWQRVFADWRQVLEGEHFWSTVRSRVTDLNDAQLTTGFVHRVRQTLPLAILLINARVACVAAEQGNSALAECHTVILKDAGFDETVVDDAISQALQPSRNRLGAVVESAKNRCTAKPHHANQYVRELHEQAQEPLSVIGSILPADDARTVGAHDSVGQAMLSGQIDYGEKTDDWKECLDLLKLAREVARGAELIERVDRNTRIVADNAKSQNDWYSPGYWELPQLAIDALERAHSKVKAGDYAGAIGLLVALDPSIGRPLRRSLSLSLSERGRQIRNLAIDEFNQPTSYVKKAIDLIRQLGSIGVPTPQTPSYSLPQCPCCSSRHYSQWMNMEYDGQRLWLCADCSSRDDREREKKRADLRIKISEALQYVLLADEVDPGNSAVRENLNSLKEVAGQIQCAVPTAQPLRVRLGKDVIQGLPLPSDRLVVGATCYFCGSRAANPECQIEVPMHGDVQTVGMIFGQGTRYHFTHVVVPRCQRCQEMHRELPTRIESWQDLLQVAMGESVSV